MLATPRLIKLPKQKQARHARHMVGKGLLRKMKDEEPHTYVVRFVGPILTLPPFPAFTGDTNAVD